MNPTITIENKLPSLVKGNFQAWQKCLHTKIAPTYTTEIVNQMINEKPHVIGTLPTRDDIIYDADRVPLQPTYARIITDPRFIGPPQTIPTVSSLASTPVRRTETLDEIKSSFNMLTRQYANSLSDNHLSGARPYRPSSPPRTLPAIVRAPGNLFDWLQDPILSPATHPRR